VGDFWEHSAVINELATNPLHPRNALLPLDAPHAFYSPYTLAWGLFSHLTHLNAIETLAIAGLCNLILFLTGLYLFVSAITLINREGVAYYSLLLILLLWGTSAWNYSGFFHLRVLGYVLPYPSTFSMGLSFFILAIHKRRIEDNRYIWWIPVLLLSVIVLLSHPFTFIFLVAGIIAISLGTRRSLLSELFQVGCLLIVTLLLGMLWPYYPLLKLMLDESTVYNASNMGMYENVLMRIWPALIGVPLLFMNFHEDWRQPLPWMFGILVTIYIIGWVFKAYSYGREISNILFILDIAIAIYLVKLESRIPLDGSNILYKPLIFSTVLTLLLILLTYQPFIRPALERSIIAKRESYEKYYFLSKTTDHYDPILADPDEDGTIKVPTFGGKLVGVSRPLAFVPDAQERLSAVDLFFSDSARLEDRLDVIRRFHVEYILLEKSKTSGWGKLKVSIKQLGKVVYQNRRFILFSVNPSQ
jgi:alpha-1,6-mannosyltransferase